MRRKKRFIPKTTTAAYIGKLRILVTSLSVLLAVAVTTLGYLVSGNLIPLDSASPGPQTAQALEVEKPKIKEVEVLFARQRIESGTSLSASLLGTRKIPAELVPVGAMLAAQKNDVSRMFAARMIPPQAHIVQEYISETPPSSLFDIPPGYRATTITIDARSGVEGYARPNSRVDVLWIHKNHNGQKNVKTLVSFARVLSVAGNTEVEGRAKMHKGTHTATLLVHRRDAKRIELARTLGTLTLSLAGNSEDKDIQSFQEEIITFRDLLEPPKQDEFGNLPDTSGSCTVSDPSSGKLFEFSLSNNEWTLTETHEGAVESVKKALWLEEKIPGYVSYRRQKNKRISEKRAGVK